MAEQTMGDLPQPVRSLVFELLEMFVNQGPRGLVEKGLFPAEWMPVIQERCADFGGRFRIPPLSAPVYVYEKNGVYDLEIPLWIEGEDDRCDLFIFLVVDPAAGVARMVDLYVP